jgi:AcrR family transcriptional regulator
MSRSPGRPRGLTVDVIVQTALDDGLDRFSMPSVAARLGVAHSGLYRYVANRDDLLVQAIERAIFSQPWPDPDQPWAELLRAVGETSWAVCEAHPGFDRAAVAAPYWTPKVGELVAGYARSLKQQGFSAEDAAMAVDFVLNLALSASADRARLTRLAAMPADDAHRLSLTGFDASEMWTGRGWYDRKLDTMLAGLKTRVSDSATV